MDREKYQRIYLHLIKTRQAFCFGINGELYTLEDVLTKLKGREVTTDEAYELITAR